MPVAITLDASELEPPQPFDQARDILQNMQQGQYLRMLHRRIPYPLFEYCRAMSLHYSVIEGSDPAYQIIVYFPRDEQALLLEGVL